MIRSLRRKFVVATMALVSFVLVAVSVGIYLYYSGSLRADGYERLARLLESPNGYKSPNLTIGGLVPEGFDGSPVFIAYISYTGDAMLLMSERFDVSQQELADITRRISENNAAQGELKDYALRYMVSERNNGYAIAFMSLTLERQQGRGMAVMLVIMASCAFLIFLALSILLSRFALKPVEQAWGQQRRFIADASHELKTPLTVILANTGILKKHKDETVAQQMDWVENTEQEAHRMKELVENMLFLAKSDDALVAQPFIPVNIRDIAANAALSFEPVAFENGLSVDIEIADNMSGAMVLGDESQLKQLMAILLDNAVKYGKEGTNITVKLASQQALCELSVHNVGEAINKIDQKHLFERFYRSDFSRSKSGYGLGLSIAKTIVEGHKGKIFVTSNGGGTTFFVNLPLLNK